jgi:hypothetical protein
MKVLRAVIQYVRATKRFQPKAQLEQAEDIIVEDIEVVEEI